MKMLNNRGDTIVEVLIALAVISGVLGISYVTINQSSNNARQAAERSQAVKLIEGQSERLKGLSRDPAGAIFSTPNLFCIDSGNNVQNSTSPATGVLQPLQGDNFGAYTAACTDASGGLPYYFSIQRSGDAANGYVFNLRARWDRAGGGADGGHEEATISYRLWP